jgi:hypothetical protein
MPNLVVNGSFETPAVNNQNNWGYYPLAQLSPWKTDAPVFEVWRDPMIHTTNSSIPCNSANGKQNLEILSKSASATIQLAHANVWQIVKTKPGLPYSFHFMHAPRIHQKSVLTVSLNGITVGVFNEDGTIPGLTHFKWVKYTVNFIAAKPTTKLNFNDRRIPAGAAGTHIDDVWLEPFKPKKPFFPWSLPRY